MPSLSMVFDVLAIDRASAVFDRVGDSAGAAGAKVDAATTSTTNAGAKIAAGLGVAAAAAAAYSVKLAADFQQSMTRLVTTAGETAGPNGIGLVSKGILDMAGQVGISAEKLAQGMYTVESAGIHGADALNVLKAAAQGAVQEQADLGKTTDALTTILHDYNIPASDAADVMSKLVTAVSTGKTNLEDFSGSLHSVTPLAAALHVPLADILGDLAAMTASGESADQATQNMADALRHLQAPTAQMTAELAQVGITSQDLSADLGTKGLAGTMQEIEQAILQHLDPATQKVLLPAFNESKTAAADLVTMIGHMPPALAQLSQGLLDGSVAVGDYRKQVQGMGGEAGATGLQFLSLYKSSDGFNQILKQGGPAAQEFTAALQKAVGDSAGLTVALQLTGEHAATVNDNIAKISGSSREAGGNIKGWAEVQGNFNQQLHEAGAALESMAIEFGTKLLPYLTDGLHFITTTAIPGIEHMGAAVGDAAHWFSQLPQPVKDVALALAALRLAEMTGLLGGFAGAARGVSTAVSTMGMEMGTAFSVAKASQIETLTQGARTFAVSGLGEVTAQSALAESAVGRLSGNLAGTGAALGAMAEKGKAAGASLVNAFGGGFGVALAGATVEFLILSNAADKARQTEQQWTEALKQGGKAADDARASMQQMDAARQRVTTGLEGFSLAMVNAEGVARAITPDAQKASQAFDAWYRSLTGVDKANEDVTLATAKLNEQVAKFGPNSLQAAEAAANLRDKLGQQKTTQDELNDAQKTGLQRLQDLATAALGAADSALAAQQADTSFRIQQQELNDQMAAGTIKGDQLTSAQLDLASSAENAAKAAAQHAADLAKQSGATDTTSIYQQVLTDKLKEFAGQLDGPGRAAIQTMIDGLNGAVTAAGAGAGAIKDLQAQIDNLHGRNVTISLIADASGPGGAAGPAAYAVPGSGTGGFAEGGYTGPGGKYQPAGIVHADEFVFTKEQTAQMGVENMYALAATLSGYSGGGYVGPPVVITEQFNLKAFNDAMQNMANQERQQQQAAIAAAAAAGGGNVQQWAGVGAQALAAEGEGATWLGLMLQRMNQESGGNPAAVNLWDSNAAAGTPSVGLMQVIGPTYASHKDPRFDTGPYAYGVSEDPMANITAAIRYTEAAYGSLSAWGQAGGYDSGGWLMPGATLAYNGTGKPERVRTAEQEAALSQPAVFHLYDSDNMLIGTIRGHATQVIDDRNTRTAVDARSAL